MPLVHVEINPFFIILECFAPSSMLVCVHADGSSFRHQCSYTIPAASTTLTPHSIIKKDQVFMCVTI